MHISAVKNYRNNNFGAKFSPEVKEILTAKLAEELKQHPEKEAELKSSIKRMRYAYFPEDVYIISKSNNTKSSIFGRLKLQNNPGQILSDILDTDILTIEQNIKQLAIKKHSFYDINDETIQKAKNIMKKYDE